MVLNEDDLPLKAREARGGLMPKKPYLLVAEDINQHWIQLLGAVVNLDPAFLSQYLNPRHPMSWLGVPLRRDRNPQRGNRAEICNLQRLAEQFRAHAEQRRRHVSGAANDQSLPYEYAESSHDSGYISAKFYLPLDAGGSRPFAGTRRLDSGYHEELARVWVSCQRLSAHACKCLPLYSHKPIFFSSLMLMSSRDHISRLASYNAERPIVIVWAVSRRHDAELHARHKPEAGFHAWHTDRSGPPA